MVVIKYYYYGQIKEHEIGGVYICMGKMRNLYKIVFRNPERKIPLGRPGSR
jgi:hypothetical protein